MHSQKTAFPLREQLFCFSNGKKNPQRTQKTLCREDELSWLSPQYRITAPLGIRPHLCPHEFPSMWTHRVLAADVPFRSAVQLGDLDPRQAREFLFREFLPGRSQALTMPTPGDRRATALLRSCQAHSPAVHCPACFFCRKQPTAAQKWINRQVLPRGALSSPTSCTCSSSPIPNTEFKPKPEQAFGYPD